MSVEKLTTRQGLIYAEILPLHVLLPPARISTLETQNVDCMNRSRVAVMHLLSQTTSRQLVTT